MSALLVEACMMTLSLQDQTACLYRRLTSIVLRAVEDDFIASDLLSQIRQRSHDMVA